MKFTHTVTYEVLAESEQDAIDQILAGGMDYSCSNNLVRAYSDSAGNEFMWVHSFGDEDVGVHAPARLRHLFNDSIGWSDITPCTTENNEEEYVEVRYSNVEDALAAANSAARHIENASCRIPTLYTEGMIPLEEEQLPRLTTFAETPEGEVVYVCVTDTRAISLPTAYGFLLYVLRGNRLMLLSCADSRFYSGQSRVDEGVRGTYVVQQTIPKEMNEACLLARREDPCTLTELEWRNLKAIPSDLQQTAVSDKLRPFVEAVVRDVAWSLTRNPAYFRYVLLN